MPQLIALALSLVLMFAGASSAQSRQEGVDLLLSKARSLEVRGRMDLASQNWQQVLLVNPNQTEALAGLAREAKDRGDAAAVRRYLDRLRQLNPKDPAIAAIERMRVITPQDNRRLEEAGRLAAQRKPDEAMKIYREVFSNDPPAKWAEAYYNAQAASTGGRDKTIADLRQRVKGEPANEVYRFWLARILTNSPKTRMEGLRLLESIHDPGTVELARPVWREALTWEQQNPSAQGAIEVYLKRYPDQELEGALTKLRTLRDNQERAANEQRGFQALKNKDVAGAEARFDEVLRRSPKDVGAVVGLASVRLDQKRFAEAVALFERARELAPDRADIREGHETARFWQAMQRASAQQKQPAIALAAYQEALAIRPQDSQARLGIAQIMLAQGRLQEAEDGFRRVISEAPDNADAIAGLGFVRLNQKNFKEAAEVLGRARGLISDRDDINQAYRTATFWSLMQQGGVFVDQQRLDDALASYGKAAELIPDSPEAVFAVASVTERKQDFAAAAKAYATLTALRPSEARGWQGSLRSLIRAGNPEAAAEAAQRVPPEVRKQLESDPEYLSQLALANYQANQLARGDEVLRRALALARRSDTEGAAGIRLEIAGLLLDAGDVGRATPLLQYSTELHPDNAAAWQGLIGAYARTRAFAQVLEAVKKMPSRTFDIAAGTPSFLNAVGAAYAAEGLCGDAERLLTRSLELDRSAGRTPAADAHLQLADVWMRQGQFAKARQAYRAVIDSNRQAATAWRGYMAAMHDERDDRTAAAEAKQMPQTVWDTLGKDPEFLSLMASVHAGAGDPSEAVRLLQAAGTRDREAGRVTPADRDLQMAWAMVESSRFEEELPKILTATRARMDLSGSQRQSLDGVWAAWRLRRAQESMSKNDSERAVTILTAASTELPGNPQVRAALPAVLVQRRDYDKALKAYEAWGMAGANAGDYRTAAGAAISAHRSELADRWLREGLERFPTDAGLLRIAAGQAVSDDRYAEAEHYLKAALTAVRGQSDGAEEAPDSATRGGRPPEPASPSVSTSATCRQPGNANSSWLELSPPTFARVSATTRLLFEPEVRAETHARSVNIAARGPAWQETPAVQPEQPERASTPDTQSEQKRLSDELDLVQNRNTPFIGGSGVLTARSGEAGVSRLVVRDGAAAGSVTAGNKVRFSVESHILNLSTGTTDRQSSLPLGTLEAGETFATRNVNGLAGGLQLSADNFGLAVGIAPSEFPVQNVTGGVRLGRGDGPIVVEAVRDHVKDSLLSYAGVHDSAIGITWGGVVSNSLSIQIAHDSAGTGQYFSVSGGLLRGERVADNWSAEASAGAYWRVLGRGDTGLSVGIHAAGMHYEKNLSFFTLGHGGYFSPQRYFLASVPIAWSGRKSQIEYEIRASEGAQYIAQDATPVFPTGVFDSEAIYQADVNRAANYDVLLRLAYRLAPHWFLGVQAGANNTRSFRSQTAGVTLRYLFRRLPTNTELRVKSIPDWRGNQPFGI